MKKYSLVFASVLILGGFFLAPWLTTRAQAQSEQFFEGKTIR